MTGELIMQIIAVILVIAFCAICLWGTLEMIKPLGASKK